MKVIIFCLIFTIFSFTNAQLGSLIGKGDSKPSSQEASTSDSGLLGGGGIAPPQLPSGPKKPEVSVGSLTNITGKLPIDFCLPLNTGPISAVGDKSVKEICKMAKHWINGLKDVDVAQVPQYNQILTPKQRKYWNRVTGCKHIQCLCQYWPKCRKHISSFNHSQDGTSNTTDAAYYIKRYGQSTRKEIRAMTDVERRRFFYALNKLKFDKIDGWSKFDILTGYHFFIPFAPEAHFSASLLMFHRELLKNFEIALRMEHPLASFPIWDPTLDVEIPQPGDTVLWLDELLGKGDGNATGPFEYWKGESNSKFPVPLYTGSITRAFGATGMGALFRKEDIDVVLKIPAIQGLTFCTNPYFDGKHAAVHLYIGGLMLDPSTSPGEPLFYLLHSFMDWIWEQWRQKHQTRKERETVFALPCPYNPFDAYELQLFPFPVKIKEVYSNIYTDEFYTFQDEPSCKNKCHDSKYLVCNPKKNRCMTKVRASGICAGYEDLDICYKSKCKNGVCTPSKSDNAAATTSPNATTPAGTSKPKTKSKPAEETSANE